jgi:hypothetical protein
MHALSIPQSKVHRTILYANEGAVHRYVISRKPLLLPEGFRSVW